VIAESAISRIQDRDVTEVPKSAGVIESITDDEAVLDRETDVVDLHVDLPPRRFAQQAGGRQRSRVAGAQDFLQIPQSRPLSTMSSMMTTRFPSIAT